MSKIIFLKVSSNQEKLFTLTKTVQKHFDLGHKILISCPTDEVASYMDLLLFRLPEDSFLPHVIANDPCNEHVIITCKKENLNSASVLLNLCTVVHPAFQDYPLVYELYDETHPVKAEASHARNSIYQAQGYPTSIHST